MATARQCAVLFGLFATHAAFADVTVRSKIDYKLGSYVPAAAAQAMRKQTAETVANGLVYRIKGKRSLASWGAMLLITDQEKGVITLLDPKEKRYASCALADYGDKLKAAMPALPAEAQQMLENFKIDANSAKTGNTEMIRGIKAEEMLINVAVDPAGAMAGMMSMKVEMHIWTATSEEMERIPAVKELAAYMAGQSDGAAPASTTARMFSQMPEFAGRLKLPIEEMMKVSSKAVLRTSVKMMMPASARMMGAANPDEPFNEMTTDLIELSADPIPDSVFDVPADYKIAPLEDLIQLLNLPAAGPTVVVP